MTDLGRWPFLIVALALGLAALSLPGRAQDTPSSRYAFSDTTLLRDTLDLKFDGLFPLADSLLITPDTLRALSIRYDLSLQRLVDLADSLRAPVDSVGPILERERYNPLAARGQRVNSFSYNSGYTVGRRSSTWSNDSDYNLVVGALFVRNVTNISFTRTNDGQLTSIHKNRSSTTEVGWRLSPDFSVGGRVSMQGTDNFKPGSIYNNSETTNQYEFSVRTRQEPLSNLRSDINFFGGPFDEPGSTPIKRGFGGVLSGHLSYVPGSWMTQDLSAQVSGRFGRAHLLERPWVSTRDISRDLRGDLGLFNASPAQVRISFRLQKSNIQTPDTLTSTESGTPAIRDYVKGQPTNSRALDASLRLQRGINNYLNFNGSLSRTQSILSVARNGRFQQDQSTSDGASFGVSGRMTWRGWSLDASFSNSVPISEQPRRSVVLVPRAGLPDTSVTIYYRQRQKLHTRSVDATLSRNLTRRLVLKLSGNVNLSSDFETSIGTADNSTQHTTDNYRQEFRVETQFNASQRFSTGVKLQVSRLLPINLLASASASNREDRTYRTDWRWTYRLFQGLTATQQNTLSANYTFYSYAPERNRLSLDYHTVTTLNAVITPRLTIALTHNARLQPSGGYVRADDGLEYFGQSDESTEYTLAGSITYRPTGVLTITVQPFYQATGRVGTLDGVAVPTNQYRSLTLAGGASLNLPVGAKGRLTGTISRNFTASRTTRFTSGVPSPEPRFQDDFWNGSLRFSWQP